jgi:MoaA/NifB/PqqE/SkfB family radical SAM enzyme
MKLSGLHLLLTYQCTFECDHCFVWGSPFQSGTMTLKGIRQILEAGSELGTVEWIYFEGGEPFMYYAPMVKGVQMASDMGFRVGIVTNSYWATGFEDAIEWLRPLSGLIDDFSISSDLFHYDKINSQQAEYSQQAAEELGIPIGVISIAQPDLSDGNNFTGQLPLGESSVMYRGRAAVKLLENASRQPWDHFSECPEEDLREPGRIHVDPLGNLHICQGISLGNLFETPLRELNERYEAESHPICGPLLAGGPTELVRRYGLPHEESYADACHLCYEARSALRVELPSILMPGQMYGVF